MKSALSLGKNWKLCLHEIKSVILHLSSIGSMLRSIQKNSGKQAYFVFSTGKTATTLPTCRSQDPAYCIHSWSSRTNIYFSTYSDLAKVLGVGKNCFSILKIIICFLFQLIKIIFSIVLKRHFRNILLLWDGLISVIISLHILELLSDLIFVF